MKSKCILLTALLCGLACASRVQAQGTFGNLDFEAATIPPGTPPGSISAAQAFPGWGVYYGSSLQPVVSYNTVFLGTASVSLQGPGQGQSYNIAGSYTALLQSGFLQGAPELGLMSVSLAQSGQVPIGLPYLQMKVYLPFNDTFQVTFAGQPIAMTPAASAPSYTLYSGYIADYAGQMAELRITALPSVGPSAGWMYLDDIRFGVPEPSTWALLAMGSFALLLRQRR